MMNEKEEKRTEANKRQPSFDSGCVNFTCEYIYRERERYGTGCKIKAKA
jgi:hypothetical protein